MIKWLRETYTALPTQRGWTRLVFVIALAVFYMDAVHLVS